VNPHWSQPTRSELSGEVISGVGLLDPTVHVIDLALGWSRETHSEEVESWRRPEEAPAKRIRQRPDVRLTRVHLGLLET